MARLLAIGSALLYLTACAAHRPYRTCFGECTPSGPHVSCAGSVIEETDAYTLGFIELDDQGWLWTRPQLETVLSKLEEEDKEQPLLLLVFVHGWKHNARHDDGNVEMFRHNLASLHEVEQELSKERKRAPRRVAGVYIGWRGLSIKPRVLKEFSFWDRKSTAHEVGRGAISEVLMRLEDFRNESRRRRPEGTWLIVVGHSFGGAAVFSALAPTLIHRFVQSRDASGQAVPPSGFGDLVVLINPAFEAARYQVLRDVADAYGEAFGYFPNQPLNLTIFSSEKDRPVKNWFPVGRWISTVLDKHRNGEQARANRTAIGHYEPLMTHRLYPRPQPEGEEARVTARPSPEGELTVQQAASESSNVAALQAQRALAAAAPVSPAEAQRFVFRESILDPYPGTTPNMPLFVVSVDDDIIPSHNAIAGEVFLSFLRQFLLAFSSENRSEEAIPPPNPP